MALMNVRLDPEDARRVAELRRAGVRISTILRQAVRAEHEQRVGKRVSARAAAALLARIYADHPDTPDVAPRGYRLDDRRAVRSAFGRVLFRSRNGHYGYDATFLIDLPAGEYLVNPVIGDASPFYHTGSRFSRKERRPRR